MGYAGNPEPTYMIPTLIADHVDRKDVLQYYLPLLIIVIVAQLRNWEYKLVNYRTNS